MIKKAISNKIGPAATKTWPTSTKVVRIVLIKITMNAKLSSRLHIEESHAENQERIISTSPKTRIANIIADRHLAF